MEAPVRLKSAGELASERASRQAASVVPYSGLVFCFICNDDGEKAAIKANRVTLPLSEKGKKTCHFLLVQQGAPCILWNAESDRVLYPCWVLGGVSAPERSGTFGGGKAGGSSSGGGGSSNSSHSTSSSNCLNAISNSFGKLQWDVDLSHAQWHQPHQQLRLGWMQTSEIGDEIVRSFDDASEETRGKSISKMSIYELQHELASRGLETKGLKLSLVQRLSSAMSSQCYLHSNTSTSVTALPHESTAVNE